MKAALKAVCGSIFLALLVASCGSAATLPSPDDAVADAGSGPAATDGVTGDPADAGGTQTPQPDPDPQIPVPGPDASTPPPEPPHEADASLPPPPEPPHGTDASTPPPPAADAGQPTPPEQHPDASTPPPPAVDAGQPTPPATDAGLPPPPPAHGISITTPLHGVNLSSAEWGVGSDGSGSLPGQPGSTYVWPDPAYASGYTGSDYFVRKGMNVFRLPFRWERLQPRRNQAFDAAELARLRTTVDGLLRRGAYVILDPHNYARYGTSLIGSSAVPNSDFADFWSRLATEYKANGKVIFNLMNEPFGLPTEQWVQAANVAIDAIRRAGANNLILAPGNAWTGAHSWTENWYGTANAVAMLNVRDPIDNTAFEVHQYLDGNFSGTSETCAGATVGSTAMQPFTNWLRANGRKGFLGEFGAGSSQTCLSAVDDLLRYLAANRDVYIGWTFWAGGPWWGGAWYSLEPSGSTDKPLMGVLARYF